MSDKERFDRGMSIRRQVMGDEHVDKAMEAATDFSRPFQEMVTEYCWGGWGREGLDLKTRSLLTVAMLAALGRSEELRGHLRGARRNGCTNVEIRETLMHVGFYAGVPAAVDAFRQAAAAAPEA